MQRVQFRGVTLNTRTRDMILAIEYLTGLTLVITQGSYNAGGVSASAGTHDGGGAADIRTRDFTRAEKDAVVLAGRQVGAATWFRPAIKGLWPEHIHMIAMNDGDLSSGAAAQVRAYINGRNGLANNGPDNGPRGYQYTTWEDWESAHPDWRGLTVGQVDEIKNFVRAELKGLEARIYAGPRYSALQNSLYTVINELRSHDGEEDARYGYYAQKLNDILKEAGEADESAELAALSAKVDKLTAIVEKLVPAAPKA